LLEVRPAVRDELLYPFALNPRPAVGAKAGRRQLAAIGDRTTATAARD
jgi:hypothetical protein